MRYRVAAFLLLSHWIGPVLAAASADAAAAARVDGFLGQLTSLRAEFRQVVTDSHDQVLERAEGTMTLARPGRFRWDYRVPEQLIISDGVTVWLYDVELEQVTVRAAGEALAGTPAMLLAGDADLDGEFEITDAGAQDGLEWSLLVPRRPDSDFRDLRLGFAGKELRRMTLHDRLGQTTELELHDIRRNPRVDESQFTFKPPPGVDVVGRAAAD